MSIISKRGLSQWHRDLGSASHRKRKKKRKTTKRNSWTTKQKKETLCPARVQLLWKAKERRQFGLHRIFFIKKKKATKYQKDIFWIRRWIGASSYLSYLAILSNQAGEWSMFSPTQILLDTEPNTKMEYQTPSMSNKINLRICAPYLYNLTWVRSSGVCPPE